jgi:hypothetical protein
LSHATLTRAEGDVLRHSTRGKLGV